MRHGSTSYSNGTTANGKVNSEEKHVFQFRGIWLPAEVIEQIVAGKITKTKLLILVMVESLVKGPGEGCWASNRYFAERIGGNLTWASESINELVRDGLLVKYDKGGRRHLETSWSTLREKPKPPSGKPEAPLREKPKENNKEEEGNRKEHRPARRIGEREASVPSCNGTNHAAKKGSPASFHQKEKKPSSFGSLLAVKVHEGLCRCHKLQRPCRNLAAWSASLDQLVRDLMSSRDLDSADAKGLVTKVVEDHLLNIRERYQPKLYSAVTIAEGFVKLEDAYKRRHGEEYADDGEEEHYEDGEWNRVRPEEWS